MQTTYSKLQQTHIVDFNLAFLTHQYIFLWIQYCPIYGYKWSYICTLYMFTLIYWANNIKTGNFEPCIQVTLWLIWRTGYELYLSIKNTFILPSMSISSVPCLSVSHLQMYFKIGTLKKFTIFTGQNLCWRFQHRCFPVNNAEFLKKAFFTEHLWWLLL